ncbi:hypothetical protein ACJX0J_011410, partial [Zea mays]
MGNIILPQYHIIHIRKKDETGVNHMRKCTTNDTTFTENRINFHLRCHKQFKVLLTWQQFNHTVAAILNINKGTFKDTPISNDGPALRGGRTEFVILLNGRGWTGCRRAVLDMMTTL